MAKSSIHKKAGGWERKQNKNASCTRRYKRRRIAVPLSFLTQTRPLTRARRRASTSPALPDALPDPRRRRAFSRRRALSALWNDRYSFRSSHYAVFMVYYISRVPRVCQEIFPRPVRPASPHDKIPSWNILFPLQIPASYGTLNRLYFPRSPRPGAR